MPYKDPEKKKQHNKQYKIDNSQTIKEWNEANKHIFVISNWKCRGITLLPNQDWESIYLFYITCEECENCGIKLQGVKRCLDHDHSTGFIRNVLCHRCNVIRG